MGDRSAIEWTDATWTPIRARNRETGRVGHFCIHKSPGCANCYAERMQPRFGNPVRFAAQDADKVELFLDEKTLPQPLRWRKPRTIFVCSMTDLFLESVPDEWIDRVFGVMATARHHRFQVLTKRADRMREYLCRIQDDEETGTERWADAVCRAVPEIDNGLVDDRCTDVWPLPNVWIGISAEDQQRAEQRIPLLLDTPAAVRFLSAEPLLGPIDLRRLTIGTDRVLHLDALTGAHEGFAHDGPLPQVLAGLDWVIAGGESGPNARPMHLQWARDLRDQCSILAAFHFKQHGEWRQALDVGTGWSNTTRWSRDGSRKTSPFQGSLTDYGEPMFGGALFRSQSVEGEIFVCLGKKRAGRMLDGRTWEEMPA